MKHAELPPGDIEERFSTIFEHGPVMVDAFDESGVCLLWNPECERRLGWTQDEIRQLENPLEVFYPDETERTRVLDAITCADGTFREYQVLAKDGSRRAQLWANFRLPNGALISMGHDVTEQRAVEAQLRQSLKMEAVGQLTAGIAHDFNNLLTVIIANAEFMMGAPRKAASAVQAAEQIRQAANQGAQLVRQLMTFTRQSRLTIEPLLIDELLDQLAPTLRRLLPETILVEQSNAADLPAVRADAVAIEQIVMNLATNARDGLDGRGTVWIETRAAQAEQSSTREPGEYVVLSVRDNGRGMSDAVRARAFEPFYTTKPNGQGTGLGLATVFALAGQHGGFVEMLSKVGSGTTAEVWLPAFGRSTVRRESPSLASELPKGNETVLVVEDEATIRQATERALAVFGYRVVTAEDGRAALALLERRDDVSLVLCDAVMPHMTGVELLAALQATKLRAIPFAFTTGYTTDELQQGPGPATPVLDKPWSLHGLAHFVRNCIDGRQVE